MSCGKILSRRSTKLFGSKVASASERESIDRFLETLIGVQIPGVINVGEADRQGARDALHHLPDEILNEYIVARDSRVGSPCFRALIRLAGAQ
jgi:hypothetical protein